MLEGLPVYESIMSSQLGAMFGGLDLPIGGPGHNSLSFGRGDDQYSVGHACPKSSVTGPMRSGLA